MNNYLSNEMMQILEERSKKIRSEVSNNMFWRLIIILIPFLIYSFSLHAKPIEVHNIGNNGACWRCDNCGMRQWQDSKNKDWAGAYHCTSCGARK